MDIEDRAEKNHRRQQVKITDDEPQRLVQRLLEPFGFFQYRGCDRITVSVADIGKAHGLELTAGALLVAEDARLTRVTGVLFRCPNRRWENDADQQRESEHRIAKGTLWHGHLSSF